MLTDLLAMLSYRRPAGSRSEERFIRRFLLKLPGVSQDAYGNIYGVVEPPSGTSSGYPKILWSSHTDTVHKLSGRQTVSIEGSVARAFKERCLGADCAAGVWLMREMYLAGVPGLYIWHRKEECGGGGSTFVSSHRPELLSGVQAAIAFDRRGKTSVITHQFGYRCCSDLFADSLIGALGGGFIKDGGGTFTDTANYVDLIPECTNISVGYENEHTSRETLDIPHLLALREKMLKFDPFQLAFSRKPGERETRYRSFSSSSASHWRYPSEYGGRSSFWDEGDFSDAAFERSAVSSHTRYSYLKDLVRDHPEVVADLLEELGISPDAILSRVYQ